MKKTVVPTITHYANDRNFTYYGRWNVDGVTAEAVTINNGSTVEFGYTGTSCRMVFNLDNIKVLPLIALWVDGKGPARIVLDSGGTVSLNPVYNVEPDGTPVYPEIRNTCHHVRFLTNLDSGYLNGVDNWNLQQGAVKFKGVILNSRESLLKLPVSVNQIEFLGDSITAGLGMLFTKNSTYTLSHQYPEGNWPELVSNWLGMRPIVTGSGGQGITCGGTGGVPPAEDAFGWIYRNKDWNPSVKPAIVVIYQGTNDREFTRSQYQTYLFSIRAAYSKAYIFAIVPHNSTHHSAAIRSAVAALKDSRIFFLDYSAGVIANTDTSDGTHLNPGGAVRLAIRMTEDIQTRIAPPKH